MPTNTKEQNNSSLLWDCFTNWALTLEKITKQEPQTTNQNNNTKTTTPQTNKASPK